MKECTLTGTTGQICRANEGYCFLQEQVASDKNVAQKDPQKQLSCKYIQDIEEAKGCAKLGEVIDALAVQCEAAGIFGDACRMKAPIARQDTCMLIEKINLPPEKGKIKAQRENVVFFQGCPYRRIVDRILDEREKQG